MRSRLLPAVLASVLLAIGLAAGPARADDPLTWSARNPIDAAGPFGFGPQALDDVSCVNASFCVAESADGSISTTRDPQHGAWVARGLLPEGPAGVEHTKLSCAPLPAPATASPCVVADYTSGDVFGTSDPEGYAPTAWKRVHLTDGHLKGAACADDTAVLCVVGDGLGVHASTDPAGGSWSALIPVTDRGDISTVSCPASSTCYAANDYDGDVYEGGDFGASWTPDPDVHSSSGVTAGLDCTTIFVCYGVQTNFSWSDHPTTYNSWTIDTGGPFVNGSCDQVATNSDVCVELGTHAVYASTDPRQGSTSWLTSGTPLGPDHPLTAVSCAGAIECVAVDQWDQAFASSDPTGGSAAWSAASEAGEGNAPVAIDCFSATSCLSVDDAGRIFAATNLAADQWTAGRFIAGTSREIEAVDCPSASECVAGDDSGHLLAATADPLNGTWSTPAKVSEFDEVEALACTPGAAPVCVAGDGGSVAVTTNPAGGASAWQLNGTDDDQDFAGISCASTPSVLCVAIETDNSVLPVTDPGDIGAWGADSEFTVGAGHRLQAVSCPTSTLCVAGGDAGDLVTSTDPTGGASAWTVTHVPGAGDIESVSCRVTPDVLCAADDDTGDVITSTNPTGGASAWTVTLANPDRYAGAIGCAGGDHCVLGDAYGNLYVGAGAGAPSGGSPSGPTGPSSPSGPSGPSGPSKPTPAQLVASLIASLHHKLAPSGKAAKLAALVKAGAYHLSFAATLAGKLTIGWYEVPAGAHLAKAKKKPVLVASGSARYAAAGTKTVKVKLTRSGRRLLKRSRRVKLTGKATFAPTGAKSDSTTQSFTLHR